MAYTVEYASAATKQLARLPSKVQDRVLDRVDDLADSPRGRGVRKLQDAGEPPLYRVRVGRDYRVVFSSDDSREAVAIVAVGLRSNIYR